MKRFFNLKEKENHNKNIIFNNAFITNDYKKNNNIQNNNFNSINNVFNKNDLNMKNKTISNKNINTTKYGEFVCSYHEWLSLDRQKENTKRLEQITKHDMNNN